MARAADGTRALSAFETIIEASKPHFLKMLKNGMVADEKRWTLAPRARISASARGPMVTAGSTHKSVSSSRLA